MPLSGSTKISLACLGIPSAHWWQAIARKKLQQDGTKANFSANSEGFARRAETSQHHPITLRNLRHAKPSVCRENRRSAYFYPSSRISMERNCLPLP